MAKNFPNVCQASGVPGGILYKVGDDGTQALYCSAPPNAAKHAMQGNINPTGTLLTDFNKLLQTDLGY